MTRTRSLIASLVAVASLAAFAGNAAAACDSWTNTAGGSWATASNWSTGVVPSTSDDVCITLPGTYTVTLAPYSSAGGDTVASLTLGGGTGTGTQTLDELGAASVTGSNETNNETRLGVTNGVTIASSGALILEAGGSIAVGAGVLTLTQPSPYSWSAANEGSISVAAGASLVLGTSFAGNAAFTNDGAVANAGAISMSTSSGAATWTQSGGSLSGNAVQLGSSTTLVDSAGAGQFLLVASPGITGTIPAGQTVTVGDQTIGTTLALKNATLVNDGTLVLDQTGTGTTSGGPILVTSGTIQNNGSLVVQVDDPSWIVHLQAGLTNAHGSNTTVAGGSLVQDSTTQTVNDGLVTLAPGALYVVEEGSSFVNAADGTVSTQIASATSFGQLQPSASCCAGAGTFTAGGTLLPVLVGGFVPAANREFQTFLLTGGTFTGTFAALGNGFSADYAHETASPAYVGSVYGAALTQTPTGPAPVAMAHVGSIAGGKGMLTAKRCSCASTTWRRR